MAWKSPTSAGGTGWYNSEGGGLRTNLYDEDIGTYVKFAAQTGWSNTYLIAYYSGGLWC